MSVNLSPLGGAGAQFFSNNGVPLAGGLLYTYIAGTSTPATTYTSSSGITALANPIVLDSAGRVPTGEIWLSDGISYKFVLKSATDMLIATWDNLSGINSNFIAYTAQQQTITATAGQTVFDLTIDYVPGANNLAVYVNGSKQIVGTNYIETDSNTVTFTAGLNVGDLVQFSTATPVAPNATSAANVSYTQGSAGSVTTNVQTKLRETISVKDFGAVGDGITNDTAAIQAAIAGISTETILYFPVGTYKISSTLEMPLKVSGNFTIDGNIKWSFKKEILQEGQITVTGTILFDSVWYSKFNHLECAGSLTIYSSDPTWGVFWNNFNMIRCATLIIDLSQGQSVNQNNFNTCKCSGGIHIQGTNIAGIADGHNNVFVSVDTTGANLTASDGTTGVHLLNDSGVNQCNNVLNWYAEISGSRLVYGNWNVLGSNIDSINNPYMIKRTNSSIFSGGGQRNGSYLAIAAKNLCASGDWSQLTGNGLPLQLQIGAGATIVALTNTPSGTKVGYKQVGGDAFRSLKINYPLTTSNTVKLTAFVYQEGSPSKVVEVYSNGVLQGSGVSSYTPLGNNWYLLRISSPSKVIDTAGGYTIGEIIIYTTVGTALSASDFRTLTNFYVTTEEMAALPSANFGQTIGYSTAVPTSGIWAVGDITYNTAPATAGYIGWVCTVAGTPGTWKPFGLIA